MSTEWNSNNTRKKRSIDAIQDAIISGDNINDIEAVRLRRYLAINWKIVPDIVQIRYTEAIKNKWLITITKIETDFYESIKLIFPDAIKNHWIDGIELDIYIPSEKINIEVDWTDHQSNGIAKDRERDEYLNSLNINVTRVYNNKKNIKNILDFLRNIVKKEALDII